MESPRLRRLILGALRGFVKPGYDYGVNSVIREELLTRALAREIDGQSMADRGILEGAIVQVVEGMRRPEAYRQAVGYIRQGNAMRCLHPAAEIKRIHLSADQQNEIRKVATLLKVLKRTDFCDKMVGMLKAA